MTRVRGPLFSISAAGTLGKSITYKKGVFGKIVRVYRRPKISKTAGQQTVRWWFQRGVWTWQGKSGEHGYYFSRRGYGLEEPARDSWRLFRTVKSLFGYYAFMKRWMEKSLRGEPQYQVPPYYGFCVANEWLASFLTADGKYHNWTSSLPAITSQYVAGILGLWHCDENLWNGTVGEVKDTSGNELNGVRVGNADTVADGKFNRCGNYPGDADYVNLGTGSELEFGKSNFTMLVWVRTSETDATSRGILGKETGSGIYVLWMYAAAGGLRSRLKDDEGHDFATNLIVPVINDDIWHQVGIIVDRGNNKQILIVDGENVSERDMSIITGNLSGSGYKFVIGSRGSGATARWKGKIDEVVVFNRALTVPEVLKIFNKDLPLRATVEE